jgi:lysyl-tRNA synthetase class 2
MTPNWRPGASIAALQARARLLAQVRGFFADRDVLEVQTPLLGRHTVTDPNLEVFAVAGGFLQSSTEYHQKRLLAAGVPDNYTLGSVFRREEHGHLHNPEFTMLEWYRCGFDDVQLRAELADLIDLALGAEPYVTLSYAQLLAEVELTAQEHAATAPELRADLLTAKALAAHERERLFVVDYPADQALLAQLHPDRPEVSRRFELVIGGIEVANGYCELLDAAEHRQRFEADLASRSANGKAAVALDETLLAALDAGLPACAGVAVGFDRLLLLQLGAQSLDAVQAFSWVRR